MFGDVETFGSDNIAFTFLRTNIISAQNYSPCRCFFQEGGGGLKIQPVRRIAQNKNSKKDLHTVRIAQKDRIVKIYSGCACAEKTKLFSLQQNKTKLFSLQQNIQKGERGNGEKSRKKQRKQTLSTFRRKFDNEEPKLFTFGASDHNFERIFEGSAAVELEK